MKIDNENLVSEFFNSDYKRGVVKEVLKQGLLVVDLDSNQEVLLQESEATIEYFKTLEDMALVTYNPKTLKLIFS